MAVARPCQQFVSARLKAFEVHQIAILTHGVGIVGLLPHHLSGVRVDHI